MLTSLIDDTKDDLDGKITDIITSHLRNTRYDRRPYDSDVESN